MMVSIRKGCGIHDPRYKKKHASNDERKHNSPPAPVISLLKIDVKPRGGVKNPRNGKMKVVRMKIKLMNILYLHQVLSQSSTIT